MTNEQKAAPETGTANGTAANANEDLSAEIARTVARRASEQVTCRRTTRNHYRCNWWAPESKSGYDNPSMQGLLVTTNRICKSHFIQATRTPDGLRLDVVSAGGASRPLVERDGR